MFLDGGRGKILMDYGADTATTPATPPMPVGGRVESVLLSHAHVDHCGSLPLITKQSNAPIYATPCTRDLSEMLLLDSLKINMQEIGGIEGGVLPFTKDDIKRTIRNFRVVQYRRKFHSGGATVTFFDGGHIPGSAMTHVDFGKKKILYTGNYNGIDTRLLRRFDRNLPRIDVLITESTYSDRDHPSRESQERELIDLVTQTVANGGIALIPSFAVGRAQELLLILEQRGIDYPVYMDGMAKKATTIINRHKNLLRQRDELDQVLKKVKYVTSQKHRQKVVKDPCAIITTSGMLDGGPTNAYMPALHDDENSTLIFTGWQAPESAGNTLLQTGRFTAEGMNLEVAMRVRRLDFSAHIGRKEMFKFIEDTAPEKVFCVHGDKTAEFAQELVKKGFDAVAPLENNREFRL